MSFAVHQVSPLISVVLAARLSVPHPMVSLPCCLLLYGVFDTVVFKSNILGAIFMPYGLAGAETGNLLIY